MPACNLYSKHCSEDREGGSHAASPDSSCRKRFGKSNVISLAARHATRVEAPAEGYNAAMSVPDNSAAKRRQCSAPAWTISPTSLRTRATPPFAATRRAIWSPCSSRSFPAWTAARCAAGTTAIAGLAKPKVYNPLLLTPLRHPAAVPAAQVQGTLVRDRLAEVPDRHRAAARHPHSGPGGAWLARRRCCRPSTSMRCPSRRCCSRPATLTIVDEEDRRRRRPGDIGFMVAALC